MEALENNEFKNGITEPDADCAVRPEKKRCIGGTGMKKVTAWVLAFLFVLNLAACSKNDTNDGPTITEYGYVLRVTNSGFVASIGDLGHVFVKYKNAKQSIAVYDTVVVEYHAHDLKDSGGLYISIGREISRYSHTMKPQSVRLADPEKGEQVFG